jgi:hypothetical protein
MEPAPLPAPLPLPAPASSTWDPAPLPFLVGAIGLGILALGSLVLLVVTLSDSDGAPGQLITYMVFTTLGSITLQVACALGAALPSRLTDGVRTALLIGGGFVGTSGGLGLLGLLGSRFG